jgi:hypothetical protein
MAEPPCTNLECYLNLPILKISLAVGVLDTLVVIPWSIYLFYKTRFSLDKVSTMQVVALILARIIFIMVWVFYSQFDPNNVDYPLIIDGKILKISIIKECEICLGTHPKRP